MRKYVLIPDSFKGTLSSREVCQIVAEAIRSQEPEAEICAIPVADGGEGTVDAFLSAVGGQQVPVACTGPYGEAITACYGLLPDGSAVVEMAAAAGLPMVGENRDPEKTTTYGVGQLIRHAAHHGAKRLVLALGGSATNDGGCGAAAAVGVKFYRATGESFVPVGGTLKDIHRIDTSGMDPAVRSIPILTMCDIDNPLCGPTGASAVFGPQKGADAAMVRRLDDGLRQLAALLERDVGRDVLNLPGGGAAGGFGAGAAAFFASPLQMGIDVVLALTDFDRRAASGQPEPAGQGGGGRGPPRQGAGRSRGGAGGRQRYGRGRRVRRRRQRRVPHQSPAPALQRGQGALPGKSALYRRKPHAVLPCGTAMKYGIFGKIQANRERQPQRAAAFLILWYDLHFPVMVYNRISILGSNGVRAPFQTREERLWREALS